MTAKEKANALIQAMNRKERTAASTDNLNRADFDYLDAKITSEKPAVPRVQPFKIRAKSSVNPRPAQ